jgi:hypothetical protein
MPPTVLNATTGSASANCYTTVAFATQYDLDRPQVVATWSGATGDQQTAALLWATRLLDSAYHWHGYPTDSVQALLWPRGAMLDRSGWFYVDLHTIPIELQWATCEYARQLLVLDRAADSDIETGGILNVKAGPVSVQFKPDVYAKVVPDAVVLQLPWHWGYPRSRSRGMRQLERA